MGKQAARQAGKKSKDLVSANIVRSVLCSACRPAHTQMGENTADDA